MHVFVRENSTMIAGPVQCDVDGIPRGSHDVSESPKTNTVHVSQVFAGQNVGIKEVADGIWLVTFMTYDLGFFDLETKRMKPLDNPFGLRVL
jgi:hypothetical protein